MKKLMIVLAFLILGVTQSNAQMLKFGVKAGANFASLEGDGVEGLDTYTSFHFGALLEVKVFENFSIQPELLYSSQGAKVNEENVKDINFNYITVPVLAKFYLISEKLSVEAGPQFSFLIDDNVGDQFESESFDFAAVGGLGFQFTENFFAQARYVAGLTDTTKDAEVKNRVIQVSLGYRF
ncbi:porin family protein [Flavobacterium lacus]|uniref:Outer membrane protein with beta-barrel domain n=1 Tax=Flavobacterium lacus TaxID=1353778 RepID=A0A328WXT6_9FLAO|nr:porin family protein [Flavobacterium lacus]RAR51033.1 outer membrane protein with beta-barrel domain [Flavobacterium lacus]